MGEIDADVQIEQIANNHRFNDSLNTEFFIETYLGDVNDETTRRLVTDLVMPFYPEWDRNDKARVIHVFKKRFREFWLLKN